MCYVSLLSLLVLYIYIYTHDPLLLLDGGAAEGRGGVQEDLVDAGRDELRLCFTTTITTTIAYHQNHNNNNNNSNNNNIKLNSNNNNNNNNIITNTLTSDNHTIELNNKLRLLSQHLLVPGGAVRHDERALEGAVEARAAAYIVIINTIISIRSSSSSSSRSSRV